MQLVIPAFNEERRLPATLEALRSLQSSACETPRPLEVIVVDNASTDATARVARELGSVHLPVRVISCATRGKGAAVRAGIAATDADLVAYMDADGATGLDALATAHALLQSGADVAVGSRAVPGSATFERHSRFRVVGAAAYRRLTRTVVPGVVDTQCGFKVFRGDLARRIFADTRTDGFSFDVEVLARAFHAGASVVEFPVTWIDVPGSSFVPARHGLASFAELGVIACRMPVARRRALVRARVVPLQRDEPVVVAPLTPAAES